MSSYNIEVDDAIIREQIMNILNEIANRELHRCLFTSHDEVALAVRDVIYSRKDEIIEAVIDRATKEIVKKGIPKLLERMDNT